MQARVVLKRPFRFVEMRVSQYSSVMEAVGSLVGFIPAQLKTWSIWFCSWTMADMKDLQSGVEPMSNAWDLMMDSGCVFRSSVTMEVS